MQLSTHHLRATSFLNLPFRKGWHGHGSDIAGAAAGWRPPNTRTCYIANTRPAAERDFTRRFPSVLKHIRREQDADGRQDRLPSTYPSCLASATHTHTLPTG